MKLREASRICLSVILAGVAIHTMLAMVDGEKVSAQGQEAEKDAFGAIFVKTDAMIPMRDGVKLHTEIYAPKNAAENYRCSLRARHTEPQMMTPATHVCWDFIGRCLRMDIFS